MEKLNESIAIMPYKDMLHRIMPYLLPTISHDELDRALDYSINKRFKNNPAKINNNYKEATIDTNLLKLTEYIISRKPIITSFGCLFTNHGQIPNPLTQLIGEFADTRSKFKKEMFKFPKGSELFNRYNLLQLVAKVDTNAIYGCLGSPSSLFYNIYVAQSITHQGRSSISAANMLFESILANNIKFGSLDEIIAFIDNVMRESPDRKYSDDFILNRNVSAEETFIKLIMTSGYQWLPTMEDCDIVWRIICRLPQIELNRIYFKNNIFEFFDCPYMTNFIIDILSRLETQFLDPNNPPDTIKDQLEYLTELIKEFVYYKYQTIDKIERVERMPRMVSLITDTDSCFVHMDPWYHYIEEKVKNIDMKIKHEELYGEDILNAEDLNNVDPHAIDDEEYKYDFYNDELIKQKRLVNPVVLIPQDGLRHSIINILAYAIGKIVNDYMNRMCDISNSNKPGTPCMMSMKNEFLLKRLLLMDVKKNYVANQELQEGNIVPPEKALDIKGMPIRKVGVPESTEKELSKILYEDILNSDHVDQLAILNKLAVLEKKIYNAIQNGSTEYFKPQRMKSMYSYKNPMSIQSVKGSVAYNALKDLSEPTIDLESSSTVLIIKVNITNSIIDKSKIRNDDFNKYEKFKKILTNSYYKDGISSIAIPYDLPIPTWIVEFIDYETIIRDNIGVFPMEAIGMPKLNTASAYSGILQL